MLPLLVRITDTKTGESEHSAFASSPVRIGRNQLNELCLNEPFVSQWHAVVRFDEHKVRYVDLGSTNGTNMNGRRLARHIQVEIDSTVDLRIGPLQLAFARAQVTPDMYAAPRTTIFNLNAIHKAEASGLHNVTMAFNPNDSSTADQNTMFLNAAIPSAGRTEPGRPAPPATPGAPTPPPNVDMQAVLQIAQQVKPFYDQYRQVWSNVLTQLKAHLERTPGPQRQGVVVMLSQQFPQLPKEPEFRSLLETVGVNPAALGDVDAGDWVKRLGGQADLPPGAQVNTALAMERVGALLESFSQAFVELRKGYEQFGEEMALQLVQERNPLHDAQSGQDVLRYLLDWRSDSGDRVRQLNRGFADLALHQVALLSGVMEGVRSMLHSMSPVTLSGQRNHALAREGSSGILEKIFNTRKAGLWKRFSDAHRSLSEEDRFSREVFGRNFARAYFMVTGGHLDAKFDENKPPGAQGPVH